MLPKKQRLTQREFKQVFERGRRFSSSHFRLVVDKEQAQEPKFAVATPKKVARGAIARNRLRRRGYAILEKTLVPKAQAHMILFVRSGDVATLDFSGLSQEVLDFEKRI